MDFVTIYNDDFSKKHLFFEEPRWDSLLGLFHSRTYWLRRLGAATPGVGKAHFSSGMI